MVGSALPVRAGPALPVASRPAATDSRAQRSRLPHASAGYKAARNRPLTRVVSLYFHRHRTTPRIPIEQFIDTGEFRDALNGPLYTDHGGTVIVDQIVRHEHLQAGLDSFSARTGLPTLTLPRADAPVPATRRHLPRPAHPRRAQGRRGGLRRRVRLQPLHLVARLNDRRPALPGQYRGSGPAGGSRGLHAPGSAPAPVRGTRSSANRG